MSTLGHCIVILGCQPLTLGHILWLIDPCVFVLASEASFGLLKFRTRFSAKFRVIQGSQQRPVTNKFHIVSFIYMF